MTSLGGEEDWLATHAPSQLLIDLGFSEGLPEKINPGGNRWHCLT